MAEKSVFQTLYDIDVSDKVKQKNGLNYLSWASAWAEVKKAFPNMPVYTYFQPPRWLCRVGDFKSMEEAYDAMLKLKGCGKFKEVAIVRENINISLE